MTICRNTWKSDKGIAVHRVFFSDNRSVVFHWQTKTLPCSNSAQHQQGMGIETLLLKHTLPQDHTGVNISEAL